MRIKVDKLLPNPYRDLENDPIKDDEVESLMDSMQKLGYWVGGFPVRVSPTKKGYFEISAGHRRLEAVKRLGMDEIEIPSDNIMDLSEDDMVRAMIEENFTKRTPGTKEAISQIRIVIERIKELLSGEWEEIYVRPGADIILPSKESFRQWKNNGKRIGQTLIKRYLGNKYTRTIERALRVIGDEELVDVDAASSFENVRQAEAFVESVKGKVPKESQKELAERIQKDKGEELSANKIKEDIDDYLIEYSQQEEPQEEEVKEENEELDVIHDEEDFGVDLDEAVNNNVYALRQVMTGLEEVLQNWEHISGDVQAEYEKAVSEFFHINKKYFSIEGGNEWKPLKLIK
jgi:hypothetical protein